MRVEHLRHGRAPLHEVLSREQMLHARDFRPRLASRKGRLARSWHVFACRRVASTRRKSRSQKGHLRLMVCWSSAIGSRQTLHVANSGLGMTSDRLAPDSEAVLKNRRLMRLVVHVFDEMECRKWWRCGGFRFLAILSPQRLSGVISGCRLTSEFGQIEERSIRHWMG